MGHKHAIKQLYRPRRSLPTMMTPPPPGPLRGKRPRRPGVRSAPLCGVLRTLSLSQNPDSGKVRPEGRPRKLGSDPSFSRSIFSHPPRGGVCFTFPPSIAGRLTDPPERPTAGGSNRVSGRSSPPPSIFTESDLGRLLLQGAASPPRRRRVERIRTDRQGCQQYVSRYDIDNLLMPW